MESRSMDSRSLDSNVSLFEDTLKFYFVEIGDEPSTEIRFAREKLSESVGEHNIVDTNGRECGRYLQNLTRKDIFVLSEFTGDVFEQLCQTEALVVGPRCVISCFMDNEMVPCNKSPVFTMAMRNLIVSLSAFTPAEKRDLKKLIGFMGGRCIDQFTENVTHLVTDKVISTKYEQAAIQKKHIMKSDWVLDVWAKSATENVLATDEIFDRHRVPVFYNLAMTTTGLKEKVKLDVKRVIEANGGQYFGEFSTSKINILILDLKPKESPKWKAAISSNKDCLTYKWIYDSVQAGFALPLTRYKVESVSKPTASTPERRLRSDGGNTTGMPNFNCTNVSNVSFANQVNETNVSQMSAASSSSRKSSDESEATSPLHRITLQDAKKAGLFLDGCNIFACGFASDEKEKIWKILNSGGATRYDTINSNVSHILVGNPNKADVAMLQAVKNDAVMLKLDWLVESIANKGAIMDYERFLYRLGGTGKSADAAEEANSAPSPASKRNILSMTGNAMKPKQRRLDFQNNEETNKANASIASELSRTSVPADENMENLILDQYLNASVNKEKPTFKMPAPVAVAAAAATAAKPAPEPTTSNYVPMNRSELSINFDDSSAAGLTDSEPELNFLEGKTVHIYGFDEDSFAALVYDCELAGATLVSDDNHSQIVDYMIVAIDIMTLENVKIKARNIVNHHWLLNAKKLNKATGIPYFYKPIIFNEELKPLVGMIVVFTTYTGDERTFLAQLAEVMGAEVQDSYRKVARPVLICPSSENNPKYNAAIKWNLPVVTCEWLQMCYKNEKRLPLKSFLVGDSISPVDDIADTQFIQNTAEPEPMEEDVIEQIPQGLLVTGGTPINPRVSSLRPSVSAQRAPFSPKTPGFAGSDDDGMSSFETPGDDSVHKSGGDKLDLKRYRSDNGGFRTPEYASSPFLLAQTRAFCEERRNRYKATESEKKKKKKSMTWTECKRRFWKEALGDAYESPSQSITTSTQGFSQVNATNACTASSSRQLTYDVTKADHEADVNIRKLDAFIQNRNNVVEVQEIIPDSAPRVHDLDLPNTELPEIVGWGNPEDRRGMRFRGTPYFSVSMSSEQNKDRVLEQIRQLNGRICDNLQSYDKKCTHFFCDRPNRGEKTCCCIASGKWVLTTDYVQKSFEAGRFLDEELFEWGNPKAAKNLPTLTDAEEPFAKAAHRMRVHMETAGTGVFHGMKAIVRTSKDQNMRNLIEAGHGKVLDDNKNKHLGAQKDILAAATHLIIQPKVANLTPDDIKAIKKSNIICVNFTYLNACITTDCDQFPLDPKPYLIKM